MKLIPKKKFRLYKNDKIKHKFKLIYIYIYIKTYSEKDPIPC